MNLLIRFIRVIFQGLFRPPLAFSEESVILFRVCPHDLDLNKHMTNSRYLSLMDLGRLDLTLRTPFKNRVLTGQWKAVLGSVVLRFQRPLRLFQKISLHTQLVGWDQKWIYVEQKICSNGQVFSRALAKCLFLDRQGHISTKRLLKAFQKEEAFPLISLTPELEHWKAMEEAFTPSKEQKGKK